ncbi:MAG: methyltransferase [Candidatus Thorarchaeota archaeon]
MKDFDLKINVLDGVYPPSEDSFLLLDCIDVGPDDSVLDVGCGTGYIALNAACVTSHVVASDVSLEAVRNAHLNARQNDIHSCQIVQSDLLRSFNTSARFSVISFNPPYLPSDDDRSSIDHAVVGGVTGTEVLERLLSEASVHLTPGGSVYTVVSSYLSVEKIVGVMSRYQLRAEVLDSESFFFETIYVVRGTASRIPTETVLKQPRPEALGPFNS